MNEKEVIRRIKQGEKALFETLVKEYYQEIYHFCFYKTGDAESAYDCTQETFLHVIRFLDGYTERNHFRAWIFGIARNVCSVQAALNRIPEMQKDVIILRFYYDMKLKEIAAVVGAGIPTVKSRLKQGMDKMKQFLGKDGDLQI